MTTASGCCRAEAKSPSLRLQRDDAQRGTNSHADVANGFGETLFRTLSTRDEFGVHYIREPPSFSRSWDMRAYVLTNCNLIETTYMIRTLNGICVGDRNCAVKLNA